MRKGTSRSKPTRGAGTHEPRTAEQRGDDLLLRLETNGVKLQNAAEELDRLHARLARDGRAGDLRERVADLAMAWADTPLRGDRGQAWLTLVGAFQLDEHVEQVGGIAADSGLPTALRVHACRTLTGFRGEQVVSALQKTLLAPTDPQVRAAAADSLAVVGDRSVAPVLEALLEEDLPKTVWAAVSAARERLRGAV
ncbi:MAG: hypothetical protein K0Q72_4422 [Armatimonadetes bacterium]|jgi:hypothetical protein|nr:hypothetical protein [Armatimonadota bacterium]